MMGWLIKEYGDLDVMRWENLPLPEPKENEVRIKVEASGMNFAETRMRDGTYSGLELPFILGMEAAGVVEAVGSHTRKFSVGDRVFGRARGSHAEYVCVDESQLFQMPPSLTYQEAAAIPVGWLTAWHALHTVAELRSGQRVLIEAVASSVGSAALQIAKERDCWVAGTASRDDKLLRAREWNLDVGYNYKHENVAEQICKATDGAGIDVGLMTIGQETAEMLFNSMGMCGKVIMYGSTSGRQVCFSLNIGVKNIELHSMSISTSPRFESETMHSFRDVAVPLFGNGKFKAVVGATLPMLELKRAHQMIHERAHFGKIVLTF